MVYCVAEAQLYFVCSPHCTVKYSTAASASNDKRDSLTRVLLESPPHLGKELTLFN